MALYNFNAARSEAQLADMKDLDGRGICIFCPEHIREDANKLVLETDHWMVKPNSFPYKNTKLHLLIIPKAHVATVKELPQKTQSSFLSVVAQLEAKYILDSYALGMRAGDMRYNGGSIEHLHAHLVVGEIDMAEFEPVRFKMSSQTD